MGNRPAVAGSDAAGTVARPPAAARTHSVYFIDTGLLI